MAKITFLGADGSNTVLDIEQGVSVMEAAVRGGIEGIDADCGGAASCGTCHVYVPSDWVARLPAPKPEEVEMLEYAIDSDAASRLSCQIFADPSLEGLTIRIPATQR